MRKAIIVAAALAALGVPARADAPEGGIDVGMIVPLSAPGIVLEMADVEIWAPWSSEAGMVECTYRLRNETGSARTATMGFLVDAPAPGRHWNDTALGFEATSLDGKPIKIRHAATRKEWAQVVHALPDSLPVWDLPIPADQAVGFLVRSKVRWTGTDSKGGHGLALRYAAQPARLWQGDVESARVAFHVGAAEAALLRRAIEAPAIPDTAGTVHVTLEPLDQVWIKDGFVWNFDHWNPAHDPGIRIDWKDPRPRN